MKQRPGRIRQKAGPALSLEKFNVEFPMSSFVRRSYSIFRGDAFSSDTFKFLASSGAGFWGTPTVASQIRLRSEDSPVAHSFVISPSVTTEGGNGVLSFVLSMTPAQTASLTPGQYVGDVEVSSSGLPKRTLVRYTLTVEADVTREEAP